ncbi:hypothetical protein KXS05_05900 [Rhizobium sp. SA279]|nr:hypothetical protein [Rhizobium rhizogenes]
MKLIGSAVEEQYRTELQEGARYLLEEGGDPGVLDLLRREIGAVKSAYYLSGYELQDYRTCNLLVNGMIVCHIEISGKQIEVFDKISIPKYKMGLKRQGQIKLQVALDMSASR